MFTTIEGGVDSLSCNTDWSSNSGRMENGKMEVNVSRGIVATEWTNLSSSMYSVKYGNPPAAYKITSDHL